MKATLLFVLLIVTGISVNAQTFKLAGSAKLTTANPYYFTMTDGTPNISGAVWSNNKIDLRYNFNIKFLLNFNNAAGTSSDGMTFTLQNASNLISNYSGSGSDLGLTGISPALSVEYDVLSGGYPYNDIPQQHLGLDKNGDATVSGKLITEVPAFDNGGTMLDQNNHTSNVVWNATTKNLSVYFDGVLKINYSADIVATIFGNQPAVYFGFTGASGWYVTTQTISYDPTSTFATEGGSGPAYTSTNTSISKINALCNGASSGSFSVTATGGTAPFTYSLVGGPSVTNQSGAAYSFTNLSAGVYTLTTTDVFGSSKIDIIQITEPALPVITSSTGSNILCANTSLDLKVSAAGSSVLFNNGYAEAPSTPAISLTNAMTIEAWVKPTNPTLGGLQYIVSKGKEDQTNGHYGIFTRGSRFWFHIWKGQHLEIEAQTTVLLPNVWYHVAGTYDGTTLKIYVNGVIENTLVINSGALIANNLPLQIGRMGKNLGPGQDYNDPFFGEIDEVRIWNVVRTASNISDYRNLNVPAQTAGLVANYSFDEGTGSSLSDAVSGNTASLNYIYALPLPVWQVSGAPINYNHYQWNPGNATDTLTSFHVTTGNTYSATVTSIYGCTNTTAAITIVAPTALVTSHTVSGVLTFCAGGSVTLTADATAASYSWTRAFGGVTTNNYATGKSIVVTQPGVYSVDVTDVNGCVSTHTLLQTSTVTVNPLPATPIITPDGPTTFCSGSANLNLSTSSTTTSNVWTPFGYGGNSIPVFLPGNYQYTVTTTDANGCQATSAPLAVTVNAHPTQYTISGGGAICAGTSTQINLSNSEVGVNYTLIGGSISNPVLSGTGSAIAFTNITEAGDYLIIAENITTHCTYSMAGTVNVSINAAPPTPTITSSTGKFDFCAGGSINLISSANIGNHWSNGGLGNQIVVYATDNFTVTVTGSNGCSATSTSVSTLSAPYPAVGISVSNYKTVFCEGETANYYVPQPNIGLTYVWTKNVSGTYGDEVPVGTGPTYSATATGWYTATATNSTGCSYSSGQVPSTFVTATKPVISTSTGLTTFCADQGQSLQLSSSGVNGGNIWSNSATTDRITINTGGTNNYTVSSLDANGCRASSDPITITGAAMPTAPTIAATAFEFCAGSSVTLSVPNADPLLTYQWLISVGGAYMTDIPGATGTSYVATTADRFEVRAKNAGGCVNWSGIIQLSLKSATAPVMDLISSASCGGVNTTNGSVQFTGVVAPFVNWSNSAGTVISLYPAVSNLGAGTYTATAQDACGVLYTKTIDVVAPAPLNATITNSAGSNTLCASSSTTLTASDNPGGYAWYQSVGGAAATYFSSAKVIPVNTSGDYYVRLQDIYGCFYTSSVTTITVLPTPTLAIDLDVTTTKSCTNAFAGTASANFVPSSGTAPLTFNGWTSSVAGFTSNNQNLTGLAIGTYTASAVDFCGVTVSKSVTISQAVTPLAVQGGGSYCAGGTGVSVSLISSEIGVKYELIKDGLNTNIFLDGTGSAISFNNITAAGTYSINGLNPVTGCSNLMIGWATVTVNALPQIFTVSGGGNFCSNSLLPNMVHINNTEAGSTYAIHQNDGSTDVIVNNFPNQNGPLDASFSGLNITSNTVTYTIVATTITGGCSVPMNGAAVFTKLAAPAIPTISAGGPTTFCPSSSVTLTSSASSGNAWTPGSGTANTFNVNQTGSYTVTTIATNGCSATSAPITVIAVDNIAPVASVGALPNITILTNDVIPTPTATDNCTSGTINGTTSDQLTNLLPGVYTIHWTYTDNSGNISAQTQSVTVSAAATPPVFKTLMDIVKNNDLGICGATVTYVLPLANGDASTTKVNITEGGGDGAIVFAIPLTNKVSSLDFITTGDYKDIVHGHGENISVSVELYNPALSTWTLVKTIQTGTGDFHFGGTSFSFPEISQVNSIRFTASQPVLAAFHFYQMNVNLNSIAITQTGGLPSGSVFPVGQTLNTYKATDIYGNTANASFKVTIVDTEKPTITNVASSVHYTDATGVFVGSGGTIAINDNCANALTVKEQYYNQQAVLFFEAVAPVAQGSYVLSTRSYPLGINTIVVTVTDAAGNAAVAKFNVTVLDNIRPIIVTPINIIRTADVGSCGASINVEPPVVSDNCSIASISVTSSNGGTGARGLYPVGITTLTWKVKDGSGNESSATQTVTVTDNQAPYINGLPNNISRTNDAGNCGAIVTWPAVTASDNCSVVTSFTSDHNSGETFPLGITTVTYAARDQYNNLRTASFTITVTDNEAPTVSTKPVTITLVNGSASITTANINNGTTDNCVGTITYSLSKSIFTCADAGTNVVTLTATDARGNSSSATAIVTVVGQTLASSILVTPTSTVFTGGIPTNLYIGYGPQSVTLKDNVVGSTTVTYAWSGPGLSANTTTQSTVFTATAAGLYNITCTATNSFGCSTTSTVSICVRDIRQTTAANSPVFVCHTNMQTGVNSTLTLAVNAVASQLQTNPQDLLGSCGMAPCSSNVLASVVPVDTVVLNNKLSVEEKVVIGNEKLTVKVSPNPSATSFTFVISTQSKLPIHVQIMDGAGRMMEVNDNAPIATAFRMGEKLISGMYYAVFIQGQQRVVAKIIKQDRF